VDAIRLADARKLAGKIMVGIADGEDLQADRKAERSSGTFEELAKSWSSNTPRSIIRAGSRPTLW